MLPYSYNVLSLIPASQRPPTSDGDSARRLRAEGTPHAQPARPALRLPARRKEPHLARFLPPLATLPASLLRPSLPHPSLPLSGPRTSPLLSVAGPAARPLGAQWSPVLGTSLAGLQAPPSCARPRLGSGERPPRGHVVRPSARAGVCERQWGCQVRPRRRVGVGGWAEGGPTGLRVGGTAG